MKKITLIFSALLFSTLGFSQLKKGEVTSFGKKPFSTDKNEHVRCGTVEYEQYLKTIDPNRQTTEQFESLMATLIAKRESDLANGRSISAIYNIPVVIHIVHNGDCVGEGENITDAQAISQITVMNQDFRRLASTRGGANTTGLAQDIEINFILAKRDPSGNPSTGVIRHQIVPYNNDVADGAGGPDWETTADVEALKTAINWNTSNYLNMYVIRPGGLPLNSGGLEGLLGYAQFPQVTLAGITPNTNADTDGVVAGFDAMGTQDLDDGSFILNPFSNLGRTMTHEVGHWLGLRHIWGDNSACPATNTDTDKDFCSDTPAASAPNYSCATVVNSCTGNPGNDQTQNYMDYTNDSCMDTFTAKQKTRMQTCMLNGTRRNSLNTSNGSVAPSAGVYFKLDKGYCSVTEGTNCSFTDVNYKVGIIKAPTANTLVNFTVDGTSTATDMIDFQIMTPSVTFPSGSTADQTMTIRYFNDAVTESSEIVKINLAVVAGGGDGVAIADNSQITMNLLDNEVAPSVNYNIEAINEDFEAPLTMDAVKDLDGDGNNFDLFTTNNVNSDNAGIAGAHTLSRSWTSTLGALTPDNIIYTSSAVTIPAGSPTLSVRVGTIESAPFNAERFSVYLTTINPSTFTSATLNAVSAVINNQVLAEGPGNNVVSANVSSFAGQNLYVVVRHHNTNDMNTFFLDDVIISSSGVTQVQTAVNNATKYQGLVNQNGTFYSADATSGNVMLDATVNNFNYGCTSVEVNRSAASAGAPAVDYGSNTANNLKVLAKTYLVTPTTPSTTGSVSIKFYLTEAEVAAWETATGNSRSALKVFKNGESTAYATVLAAFGTDLTATATTPTGLGGTYYFGTDATLLTADQFDYFNEINLYPNPTSDFININASNLLDLKGSIDIYNNLGQKVATKTVNSSSDLKVNVSNLSNGVYFINLNSGELTKKMKFIKE